MLQAPILGAGGNAQILGLLPLQTGKIFQRFSSIAVGTVDNIIQLSIPFLLQPGASLVLVGDVLSRPFDLQSSILQPSLLLPNSSSDTYSLQIGYTLRVQ